MRALLIFAAASALLVAGCNDDNNRLASLEGTVGELARMKAQLASLQQQLAALPPPFDPQSLQADIDALKSTVAALPPPFDPRPINDRLDAIEAKVGAMAPKQPHLVVDQTGEDLGTLINYPYVVWSAKVKGPIGVVGGTVLLWDQENCAGNAAITNAVAASFTNTGVGNVFRVSGPPVIFAWRSTLNNNGQCQNSVGSNSALPVADTGMANIIFPQDQLRIDMR